MEKFVFPNKLGISLQHGKRNKMIQEKENITESIPTQSGGITYGELAEQLGYTGKYRCDTLRKAAGKLGLYVRVSESEIVPQSVMFELLQYYAGRSNEYATSIANTHGLRLSFTTSKAVKREKLSRTGKVATTFPVNLEAATEKQSESVAITQPVMESDKRFTVSVALISISTLILITSAIHSVSTVLEKTFPLGWFSVALSAVICSAPLLVLIPGKITDVRIAVATMSIVFIIEIWANAISISMTAGDILLERVNHVSAFNDVTYAWAFGIGLPIISLLFEILLLEIIKSR